MNEEDTEFRDLISQSLESNGVLGKIKAQLRASIFLALEDSDKFMSQRSAKHQELHDFLQSQEGRLAFGLVRDLLEYFELDHCLAVLRPEAGLDEAVWRELSAERLLAAAPGLRGKPRPLMLAREHLGPAPASGVPAATTAAAPSLDAKSSGSIQRNLLPSPEHQATSGGAGKPGQQQQPHKTSSGGRSPSKTAGGGLSRDAEWLFNADDDDDLLPMSSVARGSHAAAGSNNSSIGLFGARRQEHQQQQQQQPPQHPTSPPGTPTARAVFDPLSSPRRSPPDEDLSSSSGRRSRVGGNFDDLPPLPTSGGGVVSAAAAASASAERARAMSGGDSLLLSDHLNQAAGDPVSDYMDDFDDSIAGGGGGGGGAGGASSGGALPSARSLKSQASDAGIEEVIEAEELTASAADEDPTDVTVDSEMSLNADYVEEAQRIGRSQL